MVWCPKKPKACLWNWNIKNFRHRSLKWDVLIQNDQMLWIVKKPNEKFQRYVIIFLWEIIYFHFYNWDRPLDLVLVLYDLIELIIKISLKTKNYSTFDTHTQHTCLIFNECVIHLFDYTCLNVMCVCSTIYGSIQKYFWSFYMFLEVIFITFCVHV